MSHAVGLVGLATLLSQLTSRIGQHADKPESITWNQTGRVVTPGDSDRGKRGRKKSRHRLGGHTLA